MEERKQNKLGTAPMGKLIASMSMPVMFSMLIQSLYNVVDSIFVAKISENALTAVSLAFPLQMLIVSVSVGTGVGINSLISRRLGQRNYEDANSVAEHGILLGIISGLVFAVVGFLIAPPFFRAFTADPEIIEMGISYTRIVMVCSFGVFIAINNEKVIQATGNSFYTMFIQLVGAVTNIILDPILIFGLLGFPKMGVAGAAIATVIGQMFGMILSGILLHYKVKEVTLHMKSFRFRPSTVRDIYAVGFPSIVMQSVTSVLTMGLNGILSTFSGAAVSVLGVYFKLQSFIFMPVFGLTQGVMPILGFNYGAGNRKRMYQALKIGIVVAVLIMTLGTILFNVFPRQFLAMFSASDEMVRIGVPALRIISWSFISAAISILLSTMFQAVGNGFYSLTVSLLRQIVLILPIAYIFSKTLGLDMVWVSFPIADILGLAASFLFFRRVVRKKIAPLPDVAPEELPES